MKSTNSSENPEERRAPICADASAVDVSDLGEEGALLFDEPVRPEGGLLSSLLSEEMTPSKNLDLS